jgi:hypothetical protein
MVDVNPLEFDFLSNTNEPYTEIKTPYIVRQDPDPMFSIEEE